MLAVTESKAPLVAHLLSLDPESRISRFMAPLSDEGVLRYCDEAEPAYAVTATDSGETIGVAEAHDNADGSVEIALTVRRDKRGMGYGGRMLARAITEASRRGYRSSLVLFSRENTAVARMCRKHGAHMSHYGTEVTARIDNGK